MVKSNKKRRTKKTRKPHKNFPLFRHQTGRWCKKVRGKHRYFGKIEGDEDGQKALTRWLEQKDDLLAGLEPTPAKGKLTLQKLCNDWLNSKRRKMEAGELSQRTHDDYVRLCQIVVATLGRQRTVEGLRPADFAALRGVLAKRWGSVRLANGIVYVKGIFMYAFHNDLIPKPVKYGSEFQRPSAKVLREAKNGHGPRMFESHELHAMLDHANVNFRAMLLLAIGGGLGGTDVALLPIQAVNLKTGWLNYPRHKTGVERRIPLWDESLQAIRDVLTDRPEPQPENVALLFLRPDGSDYAGNRSGSRVAREFTKTAKAAGVQGRTFYDLRRTFQTIGERSRDIVAVRSLMGHALPTSDMSSIYRQVVEDDRLQRVVAVVHDWLWPEAGAND